MRIVDVPDPGEPGAGEVRRQARGGRPLRLGLPLLPRGRSADSSSTRASRATRPPASSRPSGPDCPPRAAGGRARRDLAARARAGTATRAGSGAATCASNISLMGVHRTARSRSGCVVPADPGLPGRRPRTRPLAALIEPVSIAVRAVVRGAGGGGRRRSSSSAPARSGRPSPPRRSTGARPCCSSTASRAASSADGPPEPSVLVLDGGSRSRRRRPGVGRRRRARGRLRGDGRPRGGADGRRARRTGRARGHRRALEPRCVRSASATSPSRRSTSSA